MELTLAICVYNASKYIEETLQCVINQSMQDFYLLIVNDCSSDDSVEKIERFFSANPRQYKIISNKQNSGTAFTRNFALQSANTKYLLFVDGDDLFDKNLVSDLFSKIKSDEDLMGVSCWSQFINEQGENVHGGTFLGEKTKEAFIEKASKAKLIFLPIHTIFNRDLALKAGGFVTKGFPDGRPRYQDFCEELDLWTRMSDFYREGKAIVTIPKILYKYRKADGLSSNHFNMIIKMKYTKANLLRRRRGERDLTFIEFYSQLSDKQLKGYRREAKAADSLRNGAFYIKRRSLVRGAYEIAKSVYYKPGYIIDKIKHNLIK